MRVISTADTAAEFAHPMGVDAIPSEVRSSDSTARPAPTIGERISDNRDREFGEFVETHRDRAVRVAWRLVGGDAAAAEDVVQDAFFRAYRAMPRFRGEASLETWFYRILVRQAHSFCRWRGVRRLWSADTLDGEVVVPDPKQAAAGDPALRARIEAALGQLTQRQREVFVLVHLEGYSVSEVSKMLGRPMGTLKSHLHRALTSLRRELADLHAEDSKDREANR
jgi:RNA polymerase sigma-70 factor (ECF subfamily)